MCVEACGFLRYDDFNIYIYMEPGEIRYIKEFIHGDMNRTRPNFGEMCESVADILELDVERVSLDFPPPLSP